MKVIHVLILRVSETPEWQDMCAALSADDGIRIRESDSPEAAVEIISERSVDIVLSDYSLGKTNALDLLRAIRSLKPHIEVIFFSRKASLTRAIEAMKAGAFDFYEYPVNPRLIRAVIGKAREKQALYFEKKQLEEKVRERFDYEHIIGRGKAMRDVLNRTASVAPKNVNVLITGETGTGKEMVANAIHFNSPRAGRPYVKLNCSVFNEGVLESELFGHEKGAFTGALSQRTGRLELADGGTVFLDEVGDMALATQVKLLRVLQEKEFERVGSNQPVRVDVRVIAATHQDLRQLATEGRFREDLYYRLNVVHLHLPPLRDRKEDIPLLVSHFINKLNQEKGYGIRSLSNPAMQILLNYRWPGNVRELENALESAMALSEGDVIEARYLPSFLFLSDSRDTDYYMIGKDLKLDEIEAELIRMTLERTGGNKTRAANLLGIGLRTLQRKVKRSPERASPDRKHEIREPVRPGRVDDDS